MKNYYDILGVAKTAGESEIRKRYRKLAMEYHPDHNPDNHDAEEKFKEISEAYGVLTDPTKRRQYDAHLASGGTQQQYHSGFSYSQEDILRDLFRDPRFQQMFQGIMREFQRSGLRAGPHFLKKTFFGGKGGFFIGGLFLFGSLAGPALVKGGKKALPSRKSVINAIGSSIGNILGMRKSGGKVGEEGEENLDITYQTPISEQDLRRGMVLEVVTPSGDGREILKVKIPEKSRHGQKLRLKGRGKCGRGGRGDLFLHLLPKK